MKKIGILLAMLIVFSMPVVAAPPEESYAGNQLRILGILKGRTDGNLYLDDGITRAEVATIMVRVFQNAEYLPVEQEFGDVSEKHWAKSYITRAYQIGLIQGYPDGTFGPEKSITYAEVLAMMVNALGKKRELNPELSWPDNYIEKAKELGIVPKESEVSPKTEITRGRMALIVWDTLLVKIR